MNLTVLTEFPPDDQQIGTAAGHDLRHVIAGSCDDVQFLHAKPNTHARPLPGIRINDGMFPLLRRARHRFFKSAFELLDGPPKFGPGPNVLLVIGLNPDYLASMHAMGPLLDRFDVRLGYVLDGFDPEWIPRSVRNRLHRLFVIGQGLADKVQSHLPKLPVSWLPVGIDTTKFEPCAGRRWIDVMSYGRGKFNLHNWLQSYYNTRDSGRLYYFTGYQGVLVHSIAQHMTLMRRLLCHSKINLCFDARDVPRFRGTSPVLYRWFEGWAAGCTIVGRRPTDPGARELMDWPHSTIELPAEPADWPDFFDNLLDDDAALQRIAERNRAECRRRHDWRYRLRDVFETMKLPVPAQLAKQIAMLAADNGSTTPLDREGHFRAEVPAAAEEVRKVS